jgi:hypothetical protein
MCAHARVMHLTDLANKQTTLNNVKTINEYADRASNTYRGLLIALGELRRPPKGPEGPRRAPKGGDSYTAVRQADFAGQQVVMNGEPGTSADSMNTTNEQGFNDDDTPPDDPQALPAEPGGARVPQPKTSTEPDSRR